MNTKEAIEFLNDIRYVNTFGDSIQNRKVDEIIKLLKEGEELGQIKITPKDFYNKSEYVDKLKRGEKFEKMFNTILNWTMHDGSFIPVKELINLEQKYFPKEANNDK